MGRRTDHDIKGRPRSFDIDAAVARAVDVFWQHGYVGATTRLLEAELGINQSSLYNTFGSKRQLLDMALDRYEARLEEVALSPCEKTPDGVVAITELATQLQQWVTSGRQRGCLLLNLEPELGSDVSFVARVHEHRSRVLTVLTGAAGRCDLPLSRAADVALTMHAALTGLMVTARLESDDHVELVARAVINELRCVAPPAVGFDAAGMVPAVSTVGERRVGPNWTGQGRSGSPSHRSR